MWCYILILTLILISVTQALLRKQKKTKQRRLQIFFTFYTALFETRGLVTMFSRGTIRSCLRQLNPVGISFCCIYSSLLYFSLFLALIKDDVFKLYEVVRSVAYFILHFLLFSSKYVLWLILSYFDVKVTKSLCFFLLLTSKHCHSSISSKAFRCLETKTFLTKLLRH